MNEDKRAPLDGAFEGWTEDDVKRLYQAQEKIPDAECPSCGQSGTGWPCYADKHGGAPGMVCICCNCQKHFIVLSDASAFLVEE